MANDSVMTDSTTIVFGKSCDTMKLVHKFLESKGVNNPGWYDDKFDEPTALALLMIQNDMHVLDFVAGGGFSADDSKYKNGSKVVIRYGAKYYSSKNAKEPAGIVTVATSGILVDNGVNSNSLNPMKVTLLTSPLMNIADYSLSTDQQKKTNAGISFYGDLLNATDNNIDKDFGGFTGGSNVYLRKEDVIPSFSDMIISDNLTKIMKVGELVAKGTQFINDITDTGSQAKEFKDNSSEELNEYLKKQKEFEQNDAALKKALDNRRSRLTSQRNVARAMRFNENGMFIKNLITDTIIYIPFRPDSVDESYSVSWQEQNTRGSSHSVYGYEMTSGSSPSLSFDIDVGAISYYLTSLNTYENRDAVIDPNLILKNGESSANEFDFSLGEKENLRFGNSYSATISRSVVKIVTDYLNAIKALAYPRYDNGIVTPPSCYISISNNFRFVGVCTNVNISHKGPMFKCYNKDSETGYTDVSENNTIGDQIFMNYTITLNFNKIVNQDFSADTVEYYGDNWTGGMDSEPYRQTI